MNKKISCLKESPCSHCGTKNKCDIKVSKNQRFQEIIDYVMPKADYDFHDCPLYIALTAKVKDEDIKSI